MPTLQLPETFETYPSYRMLGIVDDSHHADRVVEGMRAIGLGEDLWVLTGSAAHHALDPKGTEHGLLVRLVRKVQQIGYEAQQLAEYDTAAAEGSWVIAVQLTPDGAQKDEVRDLFVLHGGRNLRYFGAAAIENVHLNAPVVAPVEDGPVIQSEKRRAVVAGKKMVDEGAPLHPPAD